MITVFERIAAGLSYVHGGKKNTIEALLSRGLIEKVGEVTVGSYKYGSEVVTIYSVPTPIHIQWCKWCSENCDDA